jgi:Tol biopolymer transport system component/DNA-binding winged helix-turn-helix (wHTH) protein
MMPASDSGGRIRFDVFEADLRSGELFKEGRRIPLPNQSFLALTALLEQPGQLVSREALRARLWPDKRVVEFEQGLNAIINRLREALGDSAGNAKFIETLPRRGYRFIAPVEPAARLGGDDSAAVAGAVAAAPIAGAVATPGPSAGAAPGAGAVSTPSADVAAGADASSATRSRLAAAYLAGGIALGLLVAVVAIFRLDGVRPTDTDRFSNLKVQPLTSLMGREVAPAFSPDGQRFAFAWNGRTREQAPEDRRFDLYVKDVDSERTLQLTQTGALSIAASWSKDGRQLAFARVTDRDTGIYLIPATGGPETRLATAVFVDDTFVQPSWSPDGHVLAYSSSMESGAGSRIHVLTLNGLKDAVLESPLACGDAGAPAFSPDGHQLAFLCTSSVAVYSVYVTALQSGGPRLLASLQGYPRGLAWMANGNALLVANDAADGSALWRLSLDGKLARIPGAEEALGPGISVVGDHVAFVREKHLVDIWRADLTKPADGGSALIASSRAQLVPQYSPDGAHIAFQSTRSGSSEIWLADADGGNPVKVTSFNGPLTGAPSWCSDGRRVAFDSRASGSSAIYIVDVLEGHPRRLETSSLNLAVPVWSDDCKWIFASDGRARLYRIAASGGGAELFTDKRAYRAAVSGQRVIFNVTDASGVQLWTKPADGGAESPLQDMPHLSYSDGWAAAPRGIYYTQAEKHTDTRSGASTPTVNFYEFAAHRTRVVRAIPTPPAQLGGLGIAVSTDEHWLLYTRSAEWESDIMMMSGVQ